MKSEYKRGYSAGYVAGCRRSDREKERERERADRAAHRAERAETQQGIGHCEECAHWMRGDKPSSNWESCAWGICTAPRAAGTPWGTYACADGDKIQTAPRFGCVLFQSIRAAGEDGQ